MTGIEGDGSAPASGGREGAPAVHEGFRVESGGVRVDARGVAHIPSDYDPAGFALLADMQERHFWYRGRHRFIWAALRRALGPAARAGGLRLLDVGGGCGGWVRYLRDRVAGSFSELIVADSSLEGLRQAESVVGSEVGRYQVDLYDLPPVWRGHFDVVCLLDVIEHLDDDLRALERVREVLVPGGLAVISVPALRALWSYNDDLAHHKRRYSRRDLATLAERAGLEVVTTRYFMFFLSPLLVLSRLFGPDARSLSAEQARALVAKTHKVPGPLVNGVLSAIFGAETPLGLVCPFPWGTSALAILRARR